MVESEQYDKLELQAKEVGLSLSSYVRLKLMERPLMIDGNKLVTMIKTPENGRDKLD